MATLKEVVALARETRLDKDNDAGKRLREIEKIVWRYHVWEGLTPQRATELLEALGPTFVKMGQIASNRSDIIPPEYAQAFKQLRAEVSPMPFSTVEETINAALGHPWQETFSELDPTPLGSASIAQVHKARIADKPFGKAGPSGAAYPLDSKLVKPGMEVAIKVRRPQVAKEMTADLALMRRAVALFGLTNAQQGTKMTLEDFVSELDRTTHQEINFNIELGNLQKFHSLLGDQPGVQSPIPFPMLSTDDILVMEYVAGPMINQEAELRAEGDDMAKLGHVLAESFVTQVVDNGFFHADPHPGNILVRDHEIVWIDLGMVGTLTTIQRNMIMRMMRAAVQNDPFEFMDSLLASVKETGDVNRGKLLERLTSLLELYMSANLQELNMGELFTQVIELLREQNLSLPPSYTLLARAMVTIEGVLTEVAPHESIISIVGKHVQKHEFSRDNLEAKAKEMGVAALISTEASVRLPAQLSHTLSMLNRGEVRVGTDMTLPSSLTAALYSVAGTMGLALIAAGLFIGSSIVCTTTMHPKLFGVPMLGVLGYVGAFVLSAYVVWRHLVIRHRQKNGEDM